MPFSQNDVADLVKMVSDKLGTLDWTEAATQTQRFIFPQLVREMHEVQSGGRKIEPFDVRVSNLDNFRHVKIDQADSVSDKDIFAEGTLDWRHHENSYVLHGKLLSMCRSAYEMINFVQSRRVACQAAGAEGSEEAFWNIGATDDGEKFFPVRYYIVKSVTGTSDGGTISGGTDPTGDGGFNGGQPWSGVYPANLNHANYMNWANKYSQWTKEDGLRKLWVAMQKCHFYPPIRHPDERKAQHPRWYMAAGLSVKYAFLRAAQAGNDNIGYDLFRGTDEVVASGIPLYWVPALDADTDYPLYGIDKNSMWMVFLEGEEMRETVQDKIHGYHRQTRVFFDSTCNLKCVDRRSNFVLSTGASY